MVELTFLLESADDEKFEFACDTFELKERWLKDIRMAIEECAQSFWKDRFDNDITTFLAVNVNGPPTRDPFVSPMSPMREVIEEVPLELNDVSDVLALSNDTLHH